MKIRKTLIIGAIGIIAAPFAAAQAAQTGAEALVETIEIPVNLADVRYVQIRNDDGQVVLSGTFSKLKAELQPQVPGSRAKGSVEIDIEQKDAQSKQKIDLDLERLAPNAYYRLVLDGNVVARFLSDKAGKREIKYTRKLVVK